MRTEFDEGNESNELKKMILYYIKAEINVDWMVVELYGKRGKGREVLSAFWRRNKTQQYHLKQWKRRNCLQRHEKICAVGFNQRRYS